MNDARLFRIANRINLLLLRELGQGIDVKRMMAETLYARDVLLVCEARPGSDLDSLARHFRVALVDPIDEHGLPSTFGPDSTGPGALDSGLPMLAAGSGGADRGTRRWFSRSR